MFTLAHLSDPHIGPLPSARVAELINKRGLGLINWYRKRHRHHRADVLDAIVADMKAQAPGHVAVTGDLVNISLPGEYPPALGWLAKLGPPHDVTLVPGNHDIYVGGAVPLLQCEARVHHEEQPALGAVAVRIVEEVPRAGEPATGACELALEEEVEHDPEPEPRRAHDVARSHALLVRAHPELGVDLVATREERGGGEALEIIDAEWRSEVRRRKLCVRLGPPPQRVRAAALP